MANKHQKTINFIFLLGVLTILYLKVMSQSRQYIMHLKKIDFKNFLIKLY